MLRLQGRAYVGAGSLWLLGPPAILHADPHYVAADRALAFLGFVFVSLILVGSLGLCSALKGASRAVSNLAVSAIGAGWLTYGAALTVTGHRVTLATVLSAGPVVCLGLGLGLTALTAVAALKDGSLPIWGAVLLPVATVLAVISLCVWLYYASSLVAPMWVNVLYIALYTTTGAGWILLGLSLEASRPYTGTR